MDPYYEQRLRDEVIYLHSLWHQGPPRSLPYTGLQLCNSSNFKKKKSKMNARQPKKVGNFSGTEWPVKPLPADPPLTQSGWPELKLKPNPQQTTRLPTPEDLEKYNWNQVQQRALKAAKEFFARNGGSDGEDSDEDDDVDDMDQDEDDVEDEEYDFFSKLLNEDEEMKGYYVKHCGGGGEFTCLVCGGANEKYRKKFKDCIALVQHSTSIAKTKKLRSHRAYGQGICKVLGWDIDRLPSSIVTGYKSGDLQGNDVNADKDVNNGANNEGLNEIIDNGESNLQVDPNGKGDDVSETVADESMVCEDLSVVANVEEENTKKQVLNEAEGGTVTNLCRNLSSTMVLEPPPPPPATVQLQTN